MISIFFRLIGANIKEFGTRFPAVSDAYDLDLRKLAFQSVKYLSRVQRFIYRLIK